MIGALLPVWRWFAKMGAPILAAFLVGQYVAGRNCEEGKLREEIATLKAEKKALDASLIRAEELRAESETRLSDQSDAYMEAITDAKRADPSFAACLGRPLPHGLRLDPDREGQPAR